MRNTGIPRALLAGAVSALSLFAGTAWAENSNSGFVAGEREATGTRYTYVCERGAFSISIFEADQGQDTVTFSGSPLSQMTVRSLGSYGDINPNVGESFTTHGPIVEDINQPNLGRQCDVSNGSVIGYGETYYRLTHRNSNAWNDTQISVDGTDLPARFGSAAGALNYYRNMLARNGNGQILPMQCRDVACNFSGTGMGNGGPAPSAPGMGRVSMTDLAMSDLSGQDIFHTLRGANWGSNLQDLDGLFYSWISVMDSLGMLNESALRQQLDQRSGNHADGTFIFRNLRGASIEMLVPLEIDDDEPEYLLDQNGEPMMFLAPVLMNDVNGSWPTSQFVDQSTPPVMPGGRPNPNYCAANDPSNSAYIPLYMTDNDVVLELASELQYLTDAQIDEIEDKGWKISAAMGDWDEAQWQASVVTNPNVRRPTYDCVLSASGRVRDQTPESCRTKDVAYYDALIDRLFVLNPELASVESHPCHGHRGSAGQVSTSVSSTVRDLPARGTITSQPATPRTAGSTARPNVNRPDGATERRN